MTYILVNNKWRNSVMNAEAYNRFSSVFTDHGVVSMKLRLSLRAPKPRGKKVEHDWKAFSTTPDLQLNYEKCETDSSCSMKMRILRIAMNNLCRRTRRTTKSSPCPEKGETCILFKPSWG